MFERIGLSEMLLIAAVALLIFGPAKLPQLGKSLGEGIKEFRSAFKSISEDEPAAPPAEKKS
ncbi:MAG TPA: twin-arginine translocase TatA/TatE family subunit [Symbiobacteriaceae bacterium]|jgi:sec-independent protein translocase protein TatA